MPSTTLTFSSHDHNVQSSRSRTIPHRYLPHWMNPATIVMTRRKTPIIRGPPRQRLQTNLQTLLPVYAIGDAVFLATPSLLRRFVYSRAKTNNKTTTTTTKNKKTQNKSPMVVWM